MIRKTDDVSARARALADHFRTELGQMPEGAWAAPGRVNVIGEHTDYNEGLALPFGIRQHVLVLARRRNDQRLRLLSLASGQRELPLSEIGPGRVSGWAAYVAGAAWAAIQDGAAATGLDLLIDSDVPMGAGLSSSAALECASLVAMSALWEHRRSRLDLARLAQRAEIEIVGMPCGLMDQLTSMCAEEGHALAVDFRSLAVDPVPLPLERAGLRLLVIDTRSPHQLIEGGYAERRASCFAAAKALGLGSLRDADPSALTRLAAAPEERSSPLLVQRARHVITENERVTRSLSILRAAAADPGRLVELGPLLSASHASLRDDFEVTVPRLDVAAEVAETAGALGARMVGGGFGGSVLALVPADAVSEVSRAVTAAYQARSWELPRCFAAVPGAGARQIL
jgi:galactokinase